MQNQKPEKSLKYYEGTLGDDVAVTKQTPGKEPKEGQVFLKRNGIRYKLEWYPAPENHPGHFQLGAERIESVQA